MATIYDTRKLVTELKEILKANNNIEKVSIGALEALATETAKTAVYISVESVALEPQRATTGRSGYDRHMLINLYCNVNVKDDALFIYDFVDSVEACVLKDNTIWGSLVNRELVAISYDTQEHLPMRGVTLLFDLTFRLACDT